MELHISNKWIKWGLFNLAVVALYGMLMRYKIGFDFPVFDQKNLLHAHSHFAFSGWISHMLYCGLVLMLIPYLKKGSGKKYNLLLLINLICSYGMLISFTAQGYKTISIIFSTFTIFTAIAFAFFFITDLKKNNALISSKPWAVAGLLLNIVSAAGPLFLAYMMITKSVSHHYYLGSVYYFLHFQYNGWFFFGAMALVTANIPNKYISLKKYFNVFLFTAVPTFFLSILWTNLPIWLYIITATASVVQLVAWCMLVRKLWVKYKSNNSYFPCWLVALFYIAAFAITFKFLLQAISVIPSLSQLVFGIRPIVIAYLHLILLGVYSIFLIGYAFVKNYLNNTTMSKFVVIVFLSGVFFNEILLGIQGFAAFFYKPVPYINQMLFGAAIILFIGATGIFLSQVKHKKV